MHTLHRLGELSSMELESDNPTSLSTISTTLNVAHYVLRGTSTAFDMLR